MKILNAGLIAMLYIFLDRVSVLTECNFVFKICFESIYQMSHKQRR